MPTNSIRIKAWRFKGFLEGTIKPPLDPALSYINIAKMRVKFDGCFLKQEKITFNQTAIITFYIAYKIIFWPFDMDSKFIVGKFFFRALKLDTVLDLMHVELF